MAATDTGHSMGGGRLTGRRIVVSGAGSGIGKATAELFAREGATLALFDRNIEAAQAVSASIAATAFEVDVRRSADVEAVMAAAFAAMGGIDGLVNAAGVVVSGPILTLTDEAWAAAIDVNLTGTFYMCRAAYRFLPASPGVTIVNLASGQGLLPGPNMSAYAASKGGVVTLTRTLAAELAPIRVNSVSPGIIDTPMARIMMPDAESVTQAAKAYALKRIGQPAEVANSILFLTSAESSYVTGISMATDGGRTYH